jgi:hypothetical protein
LIKKIIIGGVASLLSIHASESFVDIFKEGKAFGDIKYYYIQTDKQNSQPYTDSSANAHAIGGQLGFQTGSYQGLSARMTFMTTNGFLLDDPVDTSILGRDNGIRLQGSASGDIAQDSFSVLGEAYLQYSMSDLILRYGRQVMKTPLISAKEVRMLPSTVEGLVANSTLPSENLTVGASYLTRFKQRTSDQFTDIIKHALGANTQAVTGKNGGEMIEAKALWQQQNTTLSFYDYYAPDFLNSLYTGLTYKGSKAAYHYSVGAEGIFQRSVGNAADNLVRVGSVTGGKKIKVDAYSLKGDIAYSESTFVLAYSYVVKQNDAHDSLVLPWDGTPLYTNMITSNDLFASNYGKGLTADSIYIGGTRSFKIGYSQSYDFAGLKGFKTSLSYMIADNDRFTKGKQKDFNVVLAYKYDDHLSVALKGIFVKNNTSAKRMVRSYSLTIFSSIGL